MRQSKVSKQNGVPHSLGEAGKTPSNVLQKKRSAKLKPGEFALLMEEMTTAKPKTIKRGNVKTNKAAVYSSSISIPSKKDKKDLANIAHQVNVVCTPWYSILLSRRTSFLLGLWIGIAGMGLLSLIAWSLISNPSAFNTAVSITQTTSPSTITQ